MRKQLFILSAVLLSSINFLSAQITFQKTYGGANNETSSSIVKDNDGGYAIVGTTKSFGVDSLDIYLVKTDVFGNILWTRTYGGSNDDYASSIQKTIDNGYIIAGYSKSFGATSGEGYLIKTDSNGIIQWTKTYGGGDYASFASVFQTSDSGFIAGGTFDWAGPGGTALYLVKTDSNGAVVWAKTYTPGGTFGNSYINSIQKTIDGGYIVTGTADVGSLLIILMKTDAAGNPLWTKIISFSDGVYSFGNSILNTSDSGFVISGYYLLSMPGEGLYLMKSDSVGNILWSNRFSVSYHDRISSLQKSFDGYILGGYKFAGTTIKPLIIKTDLNGTPIWAESYGVYGQGQSLQQTPDSGIVLAGHITVSVNGVTDLYLIKTDANGNSGCNETNESISTFSPTAIVTDNIVTVSSASTFTGTPATLTGNGGTDSILCFSMGINEITKGNCFFITPNPSIGNFIISFEKMIIKCSVEILNTLGEKVFAINISNESKKEINLRNISRGIYFVKVFDGEKYYCKKIIIERD